MLFEEREICQACKVVLGRGDVYASKLATNGHTPHVCTPAWPAAALASCGEELAPIAPTIAPRTCAFSVATPPGASFTGPRVKVGFGVSGQL